MCRSVMGTPRFINYHTMVRLSHESGNLRGIGEATHELHINFTLLCTDWKAIRSSARD